MKCTDCGRDLTADETGLSRKLISRGTTDFYCFDCLSRRFHIPIVQLLDLVENFRASGCTLFSPDMSTPEKKQIHAATNGSGADEETD